MPKNKTELMVLVSIFITLVIILWVFVMYENRVYKEQYGDPIGPQVDNHGCLLPVGDSWCPTEQKCINILKEKCAL